MDSISLPRETVLVLYPQLRAHYKEPDRAINVLISRGQLDGDYTTRPRHVIVNERFFTYFREQGLELNADRARIYAEAERKAQAERRVCADGGARQTHRERFRRMDFDAIMRRVRQLHERLMDPQETFNSFTELELMKAEVEAADEEIADRISGTFSVFSDLELAFRILSRPDHEDYTKDALRVLRRAS